MRKIVTDEDVQRNIDHMRKRAGSDDLHEMVRAYLQNNVDWNYWYERTLAVVTNVICVFIAAALALSGAQGFYFWLASTLPPLWVGVAGVASGVAALVLLAFVARRN